MSDQLKNALNYAERNSDGFLDSLKQFLSIPSISTDPEREMDIKRAADWLASELVKIGMNNVKVISTKKHPIIFGEWIGNKDQPTILIYGHYDVQPVDPLDLWKSQPFNPTPRGESLFARGASDMKGQIIATMKAIESIKKTGELPVNVKWIIEGEEEIGSPNLESFIYEHKDLLRADFALNPDSGMLGIDSPSITYALRGLAYFELRVYGPTSDLHSGIYGGIIHNPAIALAELIAKMHDHKGRITLPNFYNKVNELNITERSEMESLPINDQYYIDQTGVPALTGEEGYSSVERTSSRPTLDVNGLLSGFTGVGSKTVIPSWAMAKISMRLVPDQDPEEVHSQLIQFLEENAPRDIRWEVEKMAGGRASVSDRDSIGVRAMSKALETVWGKPPYFKREGGSVPVVMLMQTMLGIESVLTGFGLPDDNLHAPNEKIHLPTWYRGINALIHFFMNFS